VVRAEAGGAHGEQYRALAPRHSQEQGSRGPVPTAPLPSFVGLHHADKHQQAASREPRLRSPRELPVSLSAAVEVPAEEREQ